MNKVVPKSEPAKARPTAASNARRSFWLKQLHTWHWISAALSLVGMLLFAITGITLNHAASISATPVVKETVAEMPMPLVERLVDFPEETTDPAPDYVVRWAKEALSVDIKNKPTETTSQEIYIALTMPGGDAWMTLDRQSGEAVHEKTTRGAVAYLNDLHKGRNSGVVWFWFIDVFAVACVIFTMTGLALVWLHARSRPSSWPLVGLGLLIPVIIALIFIH